MAFHIDPHIETDSYLLFEFKKSDGGIFNKTLNFLENIEVRESVSTNYSEYTPIGSNGSMFAYMGSKSRSLGLSFNLTMANIMEHSVIKPTAKHVATKESLQKRYFEDDSFKKDGDVSKKWGDMIRRFDTRWWQNLRESEKKIFKEFYPGKDKALRSFSSGLNTGADVSNDSRTDAIFQVMYWMNLIRSSVLTHSQKPYLGPPIVTLTHGMMYMSVPCICESYKISHEEQAGYDQMTYLPRRLKVEMSLREVRLRGRDFAPGSGTARNITGWDALFDEGETKYVTMDPFDQQDDIINLDK